MAPSTVETREDRAAFVRDAGLGRISLSSVLAGTLVAYGAFAVLVALAAAGVKAAGFDTDLSSNEWRRLGASGGAVVAVVLLLCYMYGGYVAGRMARRAGATHGFLVAVLGVLVAAGVAALVNVFTDGEDILRNLRGVGVPTSASEWRDVGTVAGLGSLVAMLLGGALGGGMGERWHGRVATRAAEATATADAADEVRRADIVDDGRTTSLDRRAGTDATQDRTAMDDDAGGKRAGV